MGNLGKQGIHSGNHKIWLTIAKLRSFGFKTFSLKNKSKLRQLNKNCYRQKNWSEWSNKPFYKTSNSSSSTFQYAGGKKRHTYLHVHIINEMFESIFHHLVFAQSLYVSLTVWSPQSAFVQPIYSQPESPYESRFQEGRSESGGTAALPPLLTATLIHPTMGFVLLLFFFLLFTRWVDSMEIGSHLFQWLCK